MMYSRHECRLSLSIYLLIFNFVSKNWNAQPIIIAILCSYIMCRVKWQWNNMAKYTSIMWLIFKAHTHTQIRSRLPSKKPLSILSLLLFSIKYQLSHSSTANELSHMPDIYNVSFIWFWVSVLIIPYPSKMSMQWTHMLLARTSAYDRCRSSSNSKKKNFTGDDIIAIHDDMIWTYI